MEGRGFRSRQLRRMGPNQRSLAGRLHRPVLVAANVLAASALSAWVRTSCAGASIKTPDADRSNRSKSRDRRIAFARSDICAARHGFERRSAGGAHQISPAQAGIPALGMTTFSFTVEEAQATSTFPSANSATRPAHHRATPPSHTTERHHRERRPRCRRHASTRPTLQRPGHRATVALGGRASGSGSAGAH